MRYRVLACDYDRTIALNAVVGQASRRLLRAVRASGRRLVLVTGRTERELAGVFDEPALFDLLVLENGGVLCRPGGEETLLGSPFSGALAEALQRHEVEPLVIGSVIASTAAPNRPSVVAALHDTGIRMDLIVNRDSVMALPPGVDKGSGLGAALRALGELPEACVALGDGENDVALLRAAGAGVAVENAVRELKTMADIVLTQPGVAGLEQLSRSLIEHDLENLLPARDERAG